jgi:N-acylneuraminate cytidylyltransferase
MKKVAAILPIKQKSHGLKNKNFRKIFSVPLYEITVNQALKTRQIKKIFITTDSKQILKKYKNNNKIKVIKRPKKLCTKKASTESAILHVIHNCKDIENFDDIILLQVTSPLRKKNDLNFALKKYFKYRYDSLFSCNTLEDHLIWYKKNKSLKPLNYSMNKRGIRQERDTQYLENGSIYIFNKKKFKLSKNRLFGNIGIYEMSYWQQFEIDDYKDYIFCKNIFKNYKKKII